METFPIICELGIHWKSAPDPVDYAKRLIDKIHDKAGKLAIKLQWFDALSLASESYPARDFLKEHEPTGDEVKAIVDHCQERDMPVGVTTFSVEDTLALVSFLGEDGRVPLPLDFFKVASPDAIDYRLLHTYSVGGFPKEFYDKPLFISTGGLKPDEISGLVEQLRYLAPLRGGSIYLMHCIAKYPLERLRLKPALYLHDLIKRTSDEFGTELGFGYSHHHPTLDHIDIMRDFDLQCLEVHVCESRENQYIDHEVSITVEELELLATLGIESQTFRDDTSWQSRRFWVASRNIEAGERYSSLNVHGARIAQALVKDAIDIRESYHHRLAPRRIPRHYPIAF